MTCQEKVTTKQLENLYTIENISLVLFYRYFILFLYSIFVFLFLLNFVVKIHS